MSFEIFAHFVQNELTQNSMLDLLACNKHLMVLNWSLFDYSQLEMQLINISLFW